jgi:putative membrane protein
MGEGASKQELAEDRTDWAHRRTLLAKERTFAAWLRTGLSAVAVGFGAARLLTDLEPQWLVMAASLTLIAVGLAALLLGFFSYRATLRELAEEGVRGVPVWLIGSFVALLALVAVAAAALLFLNR